MKLFIFIVLGFFGYSKLKEEPDESICAAAYDYDDDGDILTKSYYEEIAIHEYSKIAKDLNKSNPLLAAKATLRSQKLKYLSKNELMKLSDFISCYKDYGDLKPRNSKSKIAVEV
jgi:hypothetical protein